MCGEENSYSLWSDDKSDLQTLRMIPGGPQIATSTFEPSVVIAPVFSNPTRITRKQRSSLLW